MVTVTPESSFRPLTFKLTVTGFPFVATGAEMTCGDDFGPTNGCRNPRRSRSQRARRTPAVGTTQIEYQNNVSLPTFAKPWPCMTAGARSKGVVRPEGSHQLGVSRASTI